MKVSPSGRLIEGATCTTVTKRRYLVGQSSAWVMRNGIQYWWGAYTKYIVLGRYLNNGKFGGGIGQYKDLFYIANLLWYNIYLAMEKFT